MSLVYKRHLCKTPPFEVCAYLANPPPVTGQVGAGLKVRDLRLDFDQISADFEIEHFSKVSERKRGCSSDGRAHDWQS